MSGSSNLIAVHVEDRFESHCRKIADQLSLPLVRSEQDQAAFPFLLVFRNNRLALQQTGKKAPGPVIVDFTSGVADHRRRQGGGELIVKAVGGRSGNRPSVLDATAGLGRDSFVLASRGYAVTLCERSPVIAALLEDGMVYAETVADEPLMEVLRRMRLIRGDAVDYLLTLSEEQRPGVVVLDPMFPESGKSARVKKEMQVFQALVGADSDSERLLEAALAKARYRVVVKRPKKASFLEERKPTFSVPGKAIRFDVYSIRRLPD